MDKGTHFYKTDFQIHSPRDAQWEGKKCTSHEDRLAFAKKFVQACREKKIQAVGITDHHDICFIKYFQLAAQEQEGEEDTLVLDNLTIDPSKQSPIIFPGIEVTLQVPCQAIILLDADADPATQAILLQAIGVGNIHPDDDETGPTVQPLNFSLPQLNETLKTYAEGHLAGKYIILPLVGDAGHRTLLRNGFNKHFAQMPCVGGYIESDWTCHGKKHLLDGSIPAYGRKAIGVFQTTDSRKEDFRDLGLRNTWVKMAAPTAEALRQACLARESRMHQTEPQLPSIYVQRIQVTDSTFLGPINLEFNQQFSAIIGGRGTGKTSILEYLRYAMQDQPPEESETANTRDEISQKRDSIIQTLLEQRASVTVEWINNGVPHIVSFAHGAIRPTLMVGEERPVEVTPEQLRSLLPFQAYSQKQLSTVSIREKELRRFIEQPIQEQLAKCNSRIAEKRFQLETLYDRLSALNEKNRSLLALRTQLQYVQKQAQATEGSLPRLSDKLQLTLKEHPLRLREKQAIESIRADLTSAKSLLETSLRGLTSLPRPISLEESSPQQALIKKIHDTLARTVTGAREVLAAQLTSLVKSEDALAGDITAWQTGHDNHEGLYKNAEEGAKEHKQKLDLIKQLRTQEAGLQKQIADLEIQTTDLLAVKEAFEKEWHSWISIHKERGDALEVACRTLTEKSGSEIEAELQRGSDFKKALAALRDLLKGCNIRENNWEDLGLFLERDVPTNAWMKLMEEIRPLAEMAKEDLPVDGGAPEMSCWSLTPTMRKNIVERLKPARRWLEVALTSLEDLPVFYFKPARGDRIKFKNASAGQQATALLKVLLKETTGPLIIDQPEDDLDNMTIQQIAEELWTAKERRQIIFSSHNANIVVNGDAELVVHCAYREGGDRTKGHIVGEGAIDIPKIREAIQKVMEGGKKAFELRRQKYGF